jgi:hypothetical protein
LACLPCYCPAAAAGDSSRRQGLEREQSDSALGESMLVAKADASTSSWGAGPMSLVAMEHDRAQRGGSRIFFPLMSFLFSHLRAPLVYPLPVPPCGDVPRLL